MTDQPKPPTMEPPTPRVPDPFTPKPLDMDDVQRLVGALYLEIDLWRRYAQSLRAHIEANGGGAPRPT